MTYTDWEDYYKHNYRVGLYKGKIYKSEAAAYYTPPSKPKPTEPTSKKFVKYTVAERMVKGWTDIRGLYNVSKHI